jgi:CRP-like cAMP-binding protein
MAEFAGNLGFLNLGEVIQILGNNGSTGLLRINSKYAQQPGLIYFSNGDPVDADDGKGKGIDALFALFGWVDADFDFKPENVERQNVINKNRMEIILDGSRLVDDGKIEKLGPVSFKKEKAAEKGAEKVLPVIKGPLVDYMYVVDEEEYRDGDEIVIEGNYGNWMWVILEGSVEISKQAAERQLKLLRLSHGAFLGSVASFLADGSVRNTTAVARGRVQLGMLDSQRLASDYAAMTKEMRMVVSSLDKRLKEATENIVRILENGSRLAGEINARKPVIEQGKNEERLFSISNGSVTIARKMNDTYIPLVSLGKGDFFGNLPFIKIGHEPYGAAVFATKDLKIAPLDKTSLDQEYKKLPSVLKNIVENTATRLSVISLVACEYFKTVKKLKAKQTPKDEPSTPKE